MDTEYMTVRIEDLVLAADGTGIWLVNGPGGAWLSGPLRADDDMHWTAERLLGQHGIPAELAVVLHSTSPTAPHAGWTSWHPRLTSAVHTYIAVLAVPGYVKDTYPDAAPVSLELAGAYGRPRPHGAAEVPLPRDLDVIFHALSHLKWLMLHNGPVRRAMQKEIIFELWMRHLADLEPHLARMYDAPDATVA